MEREDWDERYAGEELLWRAEPNRFLVSETADLRPGRALDLACGEGRNAIWLAERGWHATGVDFSAAGLAKARRRAAERGVDVEWVEADVREWRPPGPYDLVIVFYVQLPERSGRAGVSSWSPTTLPTSRRGSAAHRILRSSSPRRTSSTTWRAWTASRSAWSAPSGCADPSPRRTAGPTRWTSSSG